jgi:hypothetical protein
VKDGVLESLSAMDAFGVRYPLQRFPVGLYLLGQADGMPKQLSLILAIILSTQLLWGKKDNSSNDPVLGAIVTRGRMLAEYDVAAWHATDAVQAMNPPTDNAQRFIAKKTDTGWVVVFGHLNGSRDKFLVLYEATQGSTAQEFKAKKCDPPVEDKTFYLAAARALDIALRDFQGEKRPYNTYVVPSETNQLYLYILPAHTTSEVYPLGGDVRYLFTADGNMILEKHQMHKTILEYRNSGHTIAGVHIHVLSDLPEDSDVFHVLSRNPPVPEFIVGNQKHKYSILVDGTIVREK